MRILVMLAGLLILQPVVNASNNSSGTAITLEQAFVRVLEHSPQLQAADFEARAAAERIRQAGLAEPWRIGVDLENVAGSGEASGVDRMESTLSLARVLETAGKPGLRTGVAKQEARLLHNEQDAKRLELLADTARHFIAVVADQERRVIATDELALAERVQGAVERRVRAGKTSAVERRRASIAVARSELALKQILQELAVSRNALAARWGDRQADFATVQGDLFALKPVDSFGDIASLLDRNPELAHFATRKRLDEARLQLAAAGRSADIELSGGVRHLNEGDDVALVFSASLPLGSRSRATPAVEAARLSAEGQSFSYEQRSLELHATLFEIHQKLSHAASVVRVLRTRIIPDAGEALRVYEKGFSAGRYSLLELTDAQQQLLDARREAVTAAADYHRYRVEIDRLTGALLHAGESS